MDVGMCPCGCTGAGGAFTAGIFFSWLFTNNILRQGDGQLQRAAAFLAEEKQGVAQPVGCNKVDQAFFNGRLTGDLLEAHVAKIRDCEWATRNGRENLFYLNVLI